MFTSGHDYAIYVNVEWSFYVSRDMATRSTRAKSRKESATTSRSHKDHSLYSPFPLENFTIQSSDDI